MKVLVRADSSPVLGVGHVARCMALVDAMARHGEYEFRFCHAAAHPFPVVPAAVQGFEALAIETPLLDRATGPGWERQPSDETTQRADFAATRAALGDFVPDLVVVDHYLLDRAWECAWPDARILAIDDLANREHRCDILFDQTLGASPSDYRALVGSDARLVLGPQFALLRPEFAAARDAALDRRQETGRIASILVNFGGSDAGGLTEPVAAQLLAADRGLRVIAVCGSAAPNLPRIRALAEGHQRMELRVDTRDMAGLLAEADLAIGAGGSTAWERCCLGLPSVVIAVAENQKLLAVRLVEAGAAIAAQSPSEIPSIVAGLMGDMARWHAMSAAAAAICDGRGAERLCCVISTADGDDWHLRRADATDSRHLWAWRNDPAARATAPDDSPIALAGHERWYAEALASDERLILVAEAKGGERLGMVRFDLAGREATVSINIAPAHRGRSLGPRLLEAGVATALEQTAVERFLASIRPGNLSSIASFERCGFARVAAEGEFLLYRLERQA